MKKKHFFPSFLFLLTIGQGIAQTPAYPGYDLAHQRLLVKVTGYFLFGINEGLIDMDSAMTLAAKGEGLPLSLWYDEAYNDGSSWPGKQQLEAGRPGAAAALLTHTPDTGRIRLLTAIGAWYLFRPGAKKTDLDTALYFLSKAKEDADILHNSRWQRIDLVFLGHCYSQRNDLQRSADAFERAEVLARAVQNNSILAHVSMDKAVCRSFFDPVRWSILDSAKQLFSASGDKIGEIEARTRIVENAFVKGEYESAEQQILQLISLTRTAGFRHLQYDYAVLAYIQQQTSGELKALDYALTAVQTMDSVKDYAFSDIFYLRVGNVYSFMGDEDAAYNWFSRSIYKKNKEGDRHWYINFIAAVNAYSVEGRVERAKQLLDSILPSYPPITLFEKLAITREQLLLASALGHFSDETRYSDELAAYCDQLSDIPQIRKDVAGGYAILSLSYAELHRPDPARFYLQKARQYPSQVISGAERLKLLKAIFILDSLAGNTHQAFRDYVFYRNVVDSFGDFRMHKQIRELGMKYDVARKEHELEVANSRNHLQQDALEKAAFQRRVAIAGLVMLLILLGLAINRYRIKKAKEKEITGKNRELERLLKEKDL
ncbi:MAG TPA: hypothetical protein VL727_18635, partial [Puia sp.]|nr:hypothetical protein [Puia sp.]